MSVAPILSHQVFFPLVFLCKLLRLLKYMSFPGCFVLRLKKLLLLLLLLFLFFTFIFFFSFFLFCSLFPSCDCLFYFVVLKFPRWLFSHFILVINNLKQCKSYFRNKRIFLFSQFFVLIFLLCCYDTFAYKMEIKP